MEIKCRIFIFPEPCFSHPCLKDHVRQFVWFVSTFNSWKVSVFLLHYEYINCEYSGNLHIQEHGSKF